MTTLTVKMLPLESINLTKTQTNKKQNEKNLGALEGVKSFRGDLEDITV